MMSHPETYFESGVLLSHDTVRTPAAQYCNTGKCTLDELDAMTRRRLVAAYLAEDPSFVSSGRLSREVMRRISDQMHISSNSIWKLLTFYRESKLRNSEREADLMSSRIRTGWKRLDVRKLADLKLPPQQQQQQQKQQQHSKDYNESNSIDYSSSNNGGNGNPMSLQLLADAFRLKYPDCSVSRSMLQRCLREVHIPQAQCQDALDLIAPYFAAGKMDVKEHVLSDIDNNRSSSCSSSYDNSTSCDNSSSSDHSDNSSSSSNSSVSTVQRVEIHSDDDITEKLVKELQEALCFFLCVFDCSPHSSSSNNNCNSNNNNNNNNNNRSDEFVATPKSPNKKEGSNKSIAINSSSSSGSNGALNSTLTGKKRTLRDLDLPTRQQVIDAYCEQEQRDREGDKEDVQPSLSSLPQQQLLPPKRLCKEKITAVGEQLGITFDTVRKMVLYFRRCKELKPEEEPDLMSNLVTTGCKKHDDRKLQRVKKLRAKFDDVSVRDLTNKYNALYYDSTMSRGTMHEYLTVLGLI